MRMLRPTLAVLALVIVGAGVGFAVTASNIDAASDLRDRIAGKQEQQAEPTADTEPEAPAPTREAAEVEPTGIVATPDPNEPLPVKATAPEPEPTYSIPPPSEPYKRCMSLEVISADVAQGYTLTANHVGSEVVCVVTSQPGPNYAGCMEHLASEPDAAEYCDINYSDGPDTTKTTRIPDSRTSW